MLKGRINDCVGSVIFEKVEGMNSGTRLDVLPGSHQFTVLIVSEPYYPNENFRNPHEICFSRSRFSVDVKTKPGMEYHFFATPPQTVTELQVMEVVRGRSGDAHETSASVKLLKNERVCGFNTRMESCVAGTGVIGNDADF